MNRWSSASIRLRLTAWYTAVFSLLVVVYAIATFVAVRHEFREQLDEHLQEEALREVSGVLVLGLPMIVVLSAVGGYVLAGRALAPIESSFAQLRRFTADASHELRTPLSVIRGVGEMGLRETRTTAEYKDALGSMLEEVDRLTRLVDGLLRLSRRDIGTVALSRDVLDLGDLAHDVVASLGVLAEERRQRLQVTAAGKVRISADRDVLRDAITNLIDNAIKYSPPGSTIDVRAEADAHHATLTVADQGPGIPPEHRDRIFDRFYRIDEGRSREMGGSGLGLAIAKWAVEANGGRISVDSHARGSVFRIVLPRVA